MSSDGMLQGSPRCRLPFAVSSCAVVALRRTSPIGSSRDDAVAAASTCGRRGDPQPSGLIRSLPSWVEATLWLCSIRTQRLLLPSPLSASAANGGGHCEIPHIRSLLPSPLSASAAEVRNHRVGFGRRRPRSRSLDGSVPCGRSSRCTQAGCPPLLRRTATIASGSVVTDLDRYSCAVQLHVDAAVAAPKPTVRIRGGDRNHRVGFGRCPLGSRSLFGSGPCERSIRCAQARCPPPRRRTATIASDSVAAHPNRYRCAALVHADAAFAAPEPAVHLLGEWWRPLRDLAHLVAAPKPAVRLDGGSPQPSRRIRSPLTWIGIAPRFSSIRTQHSLRPSPLFASAAEVHNHCIGFGPRPPGSVSLRGSAPFGRSIRCDQACCPPPRGPPTSRPNLVACVVDQRPGDRGGGRCGTPGRRPPAQPG
jgi:hypothetical protein